MDNQDQPIFYSAQRFSLRSQDLFDIMSTTTGSSTPRFQAFQTMAGPITREQTVEERYGIPENFLEIEVKNPQTHGKLVSVLLSTHALTGL